MVGVFPHHRVAYLRRELSALQRLVRKRLDTMPLRQPFDDVGLEISAQLPDDPQLRVLLEHCNNSDPDRLVQWWEADLWRELEAHVQVALSARSQSSPSTGSAVRVTKSCGHLAGSAGGCGMCRVVGLVGQFCLAPERSH
ncbi:hypothetical protein [Lentzea sp. E54]|uniref:hypothetical protein n=1 Tax=Lentzea xerophila TaxID=3435883 RepID=UPI003DA5D92F